MDKKKIRILAASVSIVLLVFVLILIRVSYLKSANDASALDAEVTKYEWIAMLCEKNGITEYNNQTAYFQDVKEDNSYFSYIQAAVEWGIIDAKEDSFNGNVAVEGKEIALTAMRILGQKKIQIYLGTDEKITDDEYIDLAIENGLIEKSQLKEKIEKDECVEILNKFETLYFGEFWKDNYSVVEYKKDIIQLSSENVLDYNTDCSKAIFQGESGREISEGSVVIFEQENTKLKVARKVESVEGDGTTLLTPVDLDKVVETLVVSDIAELTLENIVNYYGLEEKDDSVSNLNYHSSSGAKANRTEFSLGKNNNGFTLTLFTVEEEEEKKLALRAADKNTGIAYEVPLNVLVEADNEYEAVIDVDKIFIGGQVVYSALDDGIEYADVAVDAHATVSGMIKTSKEQRILLCETPVPLGNGIVGVDVQIYLVLSVDGGISFEAEMPIKASMCYERNKGIRKFEPSISVEKPTIEANCTGELALRVEPILVVFGCLKVVDLELDVGVVANATSVIHPNNQICADVSIVFPVITFFVCGDDEAETLIGSMGLTAEWEIISVDEAPWKLGVHYECLPDMTMQFVEACTYKEEGEIEETENNIESFANTYYTRYGEVNQVECPVFCFDYPDNWSITKEEVNGDSSILGEFAEEVVELTNERDVSITFMKIDPFIFDAGGRGRYYAEYMAEKVADSELKFNSEISSESGDFVVAKLTKLGDMMMIEGEDFQTNDKAIVSYAVLYKYHIDKYHGNMSEMGSIVGYYEMIAFDYPTPYVFFASAPGGQFTEEEETEVINILSSFRALDNAFMDEMEEAITEELLNIALNSGDYSYFAGTYEPCGIYNEWYGEGKSIENLVLQENGVITGGGMWYDSSPYPEEEPLFASKQEDGSYLCLVNSDDNGTQSYFLIYPEGTIGDNPYVYNDPFLTERVYIQYITTGDEPLDIIYYKIDEGEL